MNEYKIKMSFIFTGDVTIKADGKLQAMEYAVNHFGFVIGGDLHTTLSLDTIDWNFPVHPEKEIKEIKKIEDNE